MSSIVLENSHENLIKLKELSDKICASENNELTTENENKKVIKEIKKTIDTEFEEIKTQKTEVGKLKCYEKMFLHLKIILNNCKFT